MKINDNGVTRDMTAEEIAELEKQTAALPEIEATPEERLDEIEAALIELAAMTTGEV